MERHVALQRSKIRVRRVSNVYVIDLTLSDRALRVAGISQIDRFASRPRMISTGSLWRRRSR